MTQPPHQWGGPQVDPYQQPGPQGDPYQQSPYPQQPYQQNPYQQPFPYPPNQQPRGNRTAVIALSAALVVVIVAAVVTILLINKKDSTPTPTAGGGGGGLGVPSSAAPYPSGALPSEPNSPDPEPNTPGTDTTDTDAPGTDTPDTDAPDTDTPDTDQPTAGGDDEQAVIAADQAFWAAVKKSDYDEVASLTCSQYRDELPSTIKEFLDGREDQLEVTVKSAEVTGDTAQVEQSVAFGGEKDDSTPMDMKKEDGAWLVCTS